MKNNMGTLDRALWIGCKSNCRDKFITLIRDKTRC
jgi:hypothetical protein